MISEAKPILEESIIELYSTIFPDCFKIADLGCSSGPNTLLVVSGIVEVISKICHNFHSQPPTFQVFLNDLPGNDFNTIFKSLPSFYKQLQQKIGESRPCFIAAMPGSFYDRLFPNNSLHFIHSSYSIHFLSQVPKHLVSDTGVALNKGNIYLAKTSPPGVYKAYLEQFERDFATFLRHRSEEIIPGGGMVLTTMGSINRCDDPCCIWNVVSMALRDMVFEELIEEVKLDQFNLPYFAPTSEEVRKVIEANGSFIVQRVEIFKMDWDDNMNEGMNKDMMAFKKNTSAEFVSNYMRAVAEPILVSHFGEAAMDDLFSKFTDKVMEQMATEECKYINLVISLTKKA